MSGNKLYHTRQRKTAAVFLFLSVRHLYEPLEDITTSRWALQTASFGILVKPNPRVTQYFLLAEAGSLFLRTNILHDPSASQTQPCCPTQFNVAASFFSFFSRTQQLPGERGHGPDSEDHGSPAEPLHGVSANRVLSCMNGPRWKLYHRHRDAVSFLSGLHYASDTLLAAGSCNPHTFRINLLQRWLSRTLAGHLIKNGSRSTVGEARLISSPLARRCNGVWYRLFKGESSIHKISIKIRFFTVKKILKIPVNFKQLDWLLVLYVIYIKHTLFIKVVV